MSKEIPVKLGDRIVGVAVVDDDGMLQVAIEAEDVREFLAENHGLTYLSVGEDSAELGLIDE